jgi:DNA polymerase-3 subunit alpha
MRVNSIEALDQAADNVNRGVKIVLDGRATAGSKGIAREIARILRPGGKGEVRLTLEVAGVQGVAGGREIEMVLPGRYDIGAAVRGEISTVPGVLEVIEV